MRAAAHVRTCWHGHFPRSEACCFADSVDELLAVGTHTHKQSDPRTRQVQPRPWGTGGEGRGHTWLAGKHPLSNLENNSEPSIVTSNALERGDCLLPTTVTRPSKACSKTDFAAMKREAYPHEVHHSMCTSRGAEEDDMLCNWPRTGVVLVTVCGARERGRVPSDHHFCEKRKPRPSVSQRKLASDNAARLALLYRQPRPRLFQPGLSLSS